MTTTTTYPDGYWLPPGTMPPKLGDVQYDHAELDRKRGTPEYLQVLPSKGAEWTKRREWGTRHGPAVCHGGLQYVHYAENVLLPSGLRGDALGGVGSWRRPDGDGRLSWDRRRRLDVTWTWGVVEFSGDDAVFLDEPSLQPPHLDNYHQHEAELARDILGNQAMCALVRDLVGVAAMWNVCFTREWKREGLEGSQSFPSEDCINQIIADMRGRGESFMDVSQCLDLPYGEPAVYERAGVLRQMLEDMGWRQPEVPKPTRFYTTEEQYRPQRPPVLAQLVSTLRPESRGTRRPSATSEHTWCKSALRHTTLPVRPVGPSGWTQFDPCRATPRVVGMPPRS